MWIPNGKMWCPEIKNAESNLPHTASHAKIAQ